MERGGQGSQLEGRAGEPKLLWRDCPLLHGRNSLQTCLGRSGESDHEEQEEIWWLEARKGHQRLRQMGKDLISAASMALTADAHSPRSSLCFKNSSPFLSSVMAVCKKLPSVLKGQADTSHSHL